MGDGPADELGLAIDGLFAAFAERPTQARRVPAISELLFALNAAAGEIGLPFVFSFRLSPAGEPLVPTILSNAEVAPFTAALRSVAGCYLESEVCRPPRQREWAGCVTFCLCVDAQEGRYADGVLDVVVSVSTQGPEPTAEVALLPPPPDEADPFERTPYEPVDRDTQTRANLVSDLVYDELVREDADLTKAAALALAESDLVRMAIADQQMNGAAYLARLDPNERIRERALRRTASASPELQDLALVATDPEARVALARGTEDVDVLRTLARDPSPRVRAVVAWRHITAAAVTGELRGDPHPLVRASNRASSGEVLDALSMHPRTSVRLAVARNPATRARTAERLARDGPPVAAFAAANERLPPSLLAELARSADTSVREAVAGNESTPESVLTDLVHDPDLRVRCALLSYRQVRRMPALALQELLGDSYVGTGCLADQARKRGRSELVRRSTGDE